MPNNIEIQIVTKNDKSLQKEFIKFSHMLYKNCRQWVPFFNIDMYSYLRKTHPYFQNYPGQFFIAQRNKKTVGTIGVTYNERYIKTHNINTAHFFFFECIDDIAVARALVDRAEAWAKERKVERLSGPFLSGGAIGSGILIEGYEYPAMMTMMRYNFPYYKTILESLGYAKFVDLNSYNIKCQNFNYDPRIHRLAEILQKRGTFEMVKFKSKRQVMRKFTEMIHEFYNELLGKYPEDYPMADNELKQVLSDIKLICRKKTIFLMTYKGTPAGYALAFPDISRAIQKSKGRVHPISILRMLINLRTTKRFSFNGVGIAPEYQRLGGNALLYYQIIQVMSVYKPQYVEFTQIAESTKYITSDLREFIDKKHKIHRIMQKMLS